MFFKRISQILLFGRHQINHKNSFVIFNQLLNMFEIGIIRKIIASSYSYLSLKPCLLSKNWNSSTHYHKTKTKLITIHYLLTFYKICYITIII